MFEPKFQGFCTGSQIEGTIGITFLDPLPDGSGFLVGAPAGESLLRIDTDGSALGQLVDPTRLPEGFVPSGSSWVFEGSELWVWDSLQGHVLKFDDTSDNSGSPVVTLGAGSLSVSIIAEVNNLVLAGSRSDACMLLLDKQDGASALEIDRIEDTAKTFVADLSEILSVSVGAQTFVVTASHSESGLSCFAFDGAELCEVDSIGAKDGLWLDGIQALEAIDVEGQTFIIASSARSSVLVSIRVNHQGVFFVEDHFLDTRETRFEGAADFDTFGWNGRNFLIIAGQDSGLSILELLPEGDFLHRKSIAQTNDWSLGPVTQIETEIIGNEVCIYLTGSRAYGVAQLSVDLGVLGNRITGTEENDQLNGGSLDDLLLGGAGSDIINGGAGDDILIAGRGSDVLSGGAGADEFVFMTDGLHDRITDFEILRDKLNLADWGRIYHHSDLSYRSLPTGVNLSWRGESIDIISDDGQPLPADMWTADNFVF